MDDAHIASIFRAVRRRMRQVDVARRARGSRETVSRLERYRAGHLPFDSIRAVAAALDLRLDIFLRWRGGDLDRIVNAGHAALHEAIAERLVTLAGWTWLPEVTFSIYGERGVIDILAWHAATRSLLIIELKTELIDPQALVAGMGARVRLARRIARDHGWTPEHVSAWVVVSDTKLTGAAAGDRAPPRFAAADPRLAGALRRRARPLGCAPRS